jgi:endo-1,4-beta-xylanase
MYLQKITGSCIVILLLAVACRKTDYSTCDTSVSLYQSSPFPIGAAVNIDLLRNNTQYQSVVLRQFNSITPENSFKPSYLHPAPDLFYWNDADWLVDFCMANHKRLHGHTLIWYKQLPAWMEQFSGSQQDWENMFKTHIQTIVSRYKGKIAGWDVVNEGFNEDGSLRDNIWKQHIGENYIAKAFRYASEADPDAKLWYNDYNLESNPVKRRAVLTYLRDLRSSGVRVDGVGMQMHISLYSPDVGSIADASEEVIQAGFLIHFSEFDMALHNGSENVTADPNLLYRQAGKYAQVVTNYVQLPGRWQYGITFWGVNDASSWLAYSGGVRDYPLLFNDTFQPKSSFCGVLNALQ